jgi:predicted DNA-binding transcriptional regulator AlpA
MAAVRTDLLASLPPLLGSDEVAQLAGITPAGLRNRVARGDRPRAISVGRRLRFHRGEVVDWLLGEAE